MWPLDQVNELEDLKVSTQLLTQELYKSKFSSDNLESNDKSSIGKTHMPFYYGSKYHDQQMNSSAAASSHHFIKDKDIKQSAAATQVIKNSKEK